MDHDSALITGLATLAGAVVGGGLSLTGQILSAHHERVRRRRQFQLENYLDLQDSALDLARVYTKLVQYIVHSPEDLPASDDLPIPDLIQIDVANATRRFYRAKERCTSERMRQRLGDYTKQLADILARLQKAEYEGLRGTKQAAKEELDAAFNGISAALGVEIQSLAK